MTFIFSAFLCNSGSELANLYNAITVLENHHAALGFRLSTSNDQVTIRHCKTNSLLYCIVSFIKSSDGFTSIYKIHNNELNWRELIKQLDVFELPLMLTITLHSINWCIVFLKKESYLYNHFDMPYMVDWISLKKG